MVSNDMVPQSVAAREGAAHAATSAEVAFNQSAFDEFILSRRVIGFFDKPITLKSGRQSFWYVNWRTVSEDAFSLNSLADFVCSYTQDLVRTRALPRTPDTIFGVAEGATKVALFAQMKLAMQSGTFAVGSHALAMGRGKAKEHGDPKDKYFLGMPRGLTIVVEDVTTTGGSLVTCVQQLREASVDSNVAVGLTNRMERRDDGKSVAEALKSLAPPVTYFHMSSALELLPKAAELQKPSKEVRAAIMEEFARFGVAKLTL